MVAVGWPAVPPPERAPMAGDEGLLEA